MPSVHSIILADNGHSFQIGVVLEERITKTRTAETTSYLCAFYDPNHQPGDTPFCAVVQEDKVTKIQTGYTFTADGFLATSPAYAWAQSHIAKLEPVPASDAAATSAQDAATPAS